MAFTTVPYAGQLVTNGNDFGWCSVSPTKAFLIYTAWTSTLNAGVRKLIIQAVYFNGKNPATFGPACAVGIINGTFNVTPSITVLTDGRLFASVRESTGQFSYSVYNVESGDLVSLSYKHGTLFTPLGTYTAVAVEGINNNKVISTQNATSSNQFAIITVGESAMTIAPTSGASLITHTTNGFTGTANQLTGHSIRRDKTGNVLVIRSFLGALVSGSQANGIQLTTFDPDGNLLNFGALGAALIGGVDALGVQKGRDILLLSANTVLSLGAKSASAGAGGSTSGENGFARLTLAAATGSAHSASELIPYRDTKAAMFVDCLWLDDDYFFALAFNLPGSNVLGNRDVMQWSPAPTSLSPQVAYIGKYNNASNSIVISDNMPLALPDQTFSGTSQTKFLHRISNTEVAIIQPTYLASSNGGQNFEINVTVIGA